MPAELKTIREMCDEFDVTPRTLRFYESKSLITPRRDGKHRLYSRTDRARMKLILRGKRFGFSLEQIGHLMDLYYIGDGQYTQLAETCRHGSARLDQMKRQRAELDDAIIDLQEQLRCGERLLATMHRKPESIPSQDRSET